MTRLAIISTILGLVVVAGRLPGVIAPAKFRAYAVKFPRSVWWGRILMGIATIWAGIVLFGAATNAVTDEIRTTGNAGIWALARPLVIIGVPVGYWLVIQFANQFLAVRGAAALLLLVAKVMLDAADASDIPARLVITVMAYLMVITATWMAIAPHHSRDVIGYLMANDRRCRTVCSVGVAAGVMLVALGLFVY